MRLYFMDARLKHSGMTGMETSLRLEPSRMNVSSRPQYYNWTHVRLAVKPNLDWF